MCIPTNQKSVTWQVLGCCPIYHGGPYPWSMQRYWQPDWWKSLFPSGALCNVEWLYREQPRPPRSCRRARREPKSWDPMTRSLEQQCLTGHRRRSSCTPTQILPLTSASERPCHQWDGAHTRCPKRRNPWILNL